MKSILSILPQSVKKRIKNLYFQYAFWTYKITGKAPYPKAVIIDPSNFCNLSCPLCNNGSGLMKAEKAFMEVGLFKKILREIPTIKHISLFNWGESFLNSKINKLIKIAKDNGIQVSIHSNLSFKKDDEFWREMINAGPDEIEVSLDGTTQDAYEKYRVNGELSLVVSNIKNIVKIEKELGKKKPRIFWKFMVNKFNQEQVKEAKRMASELGISFETTTISVGEGSPEVKFPGSVPSRVEKWISSKNEYSKDRYRGKTKFPLFEGKCDQLFNTLAISPTGKVLPCCFLSNDENAFGDISKESFADIWNNKKYRYARSLFSKKKRKLEAEVVCNRCNYFKKS